ncbi:MAG: ABC transporter substrate-binding protein, partial [Rikenellaceae bacterium]
LELSLTYGLEHIYEAILEYRPEESIVEAYSYLTESLDFLLDGDKREALKRFWAIDTNIVAKTLPG